MSVEIKTLIHEACVAIIEGKSTETIMNILQQITGKYDPQSEDIEITALTRCLKQTDREYSEMMQIMRTICNPIVSIVALDLAGIVPKPRNKSLHENLLQMNYADIFLVSISTVSIAMLVYTIYKS